MSGEDEDSDESQCSRSTTKGRTKRRMKLEPEQLHLRSFRTEVGVEFAGQVLHALLLGDLDHPLLVQLRKRNERTRQDSDQPANSDRAARAKGNPHWRTPSSRQDRHKAERSANWGSTIGRNKRQSSRQRGRGKVEKARRTLSYFAIASASSALRWSFTAWMFCTKEQQQYQLQTSGAGTWSQDTQAQRQRGMQARPTAPILCSHQSNTTRTATCSQEQTGESGDSRSSRAAGCRTGGLCCRAPLSRRSPWSSA